MSMISGGHTDGYYDEKASLSVEQAVAEQVYRARRLKQSDAGSQGTDSPLAALGMQLSRVDEVRSRIGALAERLLGPRGAELARGDSLPVYGGLVGLLEAETATLRQRIDEMMNDLSAIEKVFP